MTGFSSSRRRSYGTGSLETRRDRHGRQTYYVQLGSVLDASKLRKRFKDALLAAGVRPIRFHDLRHTFGTQAAAAGAPLRTLQEWMGHRDYKTTLIYADYAPRPHERAMMERAFSTPEFSVRHEDEDASRSR